MQIMVALIISTIAGLSTVLGGLAIFLKPKKENISKFITFCLSFSLAVMIMISITDLIPDSTLILISKYGVIKGIIICLVTFVLGGCLINIVNNKVKNFESKKVSDSNLYRVGILSMIALMLHNFPEGVAVFMSTYKDVSLGISLAIAICLHNLSEGVAIAVPIYYATGKKGNALFKTFISGLAEPLGAILAFLFLYRFITDVFISIVLLFVAGIMISLAINSLFPKAKEYNEDKFIVFGLIIGFILMLLNHLLF